MKNIEDKEFNKKFDALLEQYYENDTDFGLFLKMTPKRYRKSLIDNMPKKEVAQLIFTDLPEVFKRLEQEN